MAQLTYKDAGVDIDAGNELVNRIKPFAKATRRKGSVDDLGGFGALFDLKKTGYKDPLLVSSTDGVGTKLKVAQISGKHDTIGIDLVAMCVNDLVVQGAEPLFFLDYFATGHLDVKTASAVIKGIAAGCKEAGCALIGGETAEMPGMYAAGEYDLAGFTVGAVDRKKLLPKNVKKGDVLLGLASVGLHSTGFSLARHIVAEKQLNYGSPAPFNTKVSLADGLLAPTRIYVKSCLAAIKSGGVHALAHITGGGLLENIPRVLPKNLAVKIEIGSWDMPPVFKWLKDAGNMHDAEMWRTFNCGIGMVLVVDKARVKKITALLKKSGEKVFVMGEVIAKKDKAVVMHG